MSALPFVIVKDLASYGRRILHGHDVVHPVNVGGQGTDPQPQAEDSIAVSDGHRQRVEIGEVILSQVKIGGGSVLLQVGDTLGAGDGDHPLALGEDPGERDLPRGGAAAFGDLPDGLDEGLVRRHRPPG